MSRKKVAPNANNKEDISCLPEQELEFLRKRVKDQRREIFSLRRERATDSEIKKYLFDLKDVEPTIPEWTVKINRKHKTSGVPILMLSDWHSNEVVKASQVFHKNEFNSTVLKRRVRLLIENTIDVLRNHLFKHPNYPGMVLLLNGDFISGDIHEELTATNEKPIMPALLETFNLLCWVIDQLRGEFGKVMVFATAGGNHSRTTKKKPFKDKAYTNYDWLMYNLLSKWFEDIKSVNFSISDGDDIQFKIYTHRYRMTHGDQFRGGQGFIGPYAPITRGEIKKRSAAETYGMNYDTLLIGHFHQLMTLNRVIVNGSIVGYNELAIQCNFPYEPPKQALWMTHPSRGITFSAPIFCEKPSKAIKEEWVSWTK